MKAPARSVGLLIAALAGITSVACGAGNVLVDFHPAAQWSGTGIVPLPDGSFIAYRNGLTRLNANGTPVSGFATDLIQSGVTRMCAVDAQGSLFIGPGGVRPDGAGSSILKLNASGRTNLGFAPVTIGSVFIGDVVVSGLSALCGDDNGGCIAGGLFRLVNASPASGLGRFDASGTYTDLGNPLPTGDSPVFLARTADGFWVLGTTDVCVISPGGPVLHRVPAHAWMNVRGVTYSPVFGLAIIAEKADHSAGMYLYNDDGTLRRSFDLNFNVPSAIAWDHQGRIVAAGVAGAARSDVVRFLDDGTRDPAWSRGLTFNYNEFFVAVLADDSVVVTGSFTKVNGEDTPGIVRLSGAPGIRLMPNISSRTYVDDKHRLIIGFVIDGDRSVDVLLRVVGPSLASYGVTEPLPLTQFEVYRDGNRLLQQYSGNQGNPYGISYADVEAQVGAFPLRYGDATTVVQLRPGVYSLVASSRPGDAGEVLGEAYFVP